MQPEEHSTILDDRLLLLTVTQLGLGAGLIEEPSERILLADLYHQAAELAMRRVALELAIGFLDNGRAHLGDQELAWTKHRDLAWRLDKDLVRMLFCSGRQLEALVLANKLLRRDLSPLERRSIVLVKVQ